MERPKTNTLPRCKLFNLSLEGKKGKIYRNVQIRLEIHALSCSIRITPIPTTIYEPLIPHRNYIIRIQSSNKRTRFRRPLRNNTYFIPITPRFIRQLPREDCSTIHIPTHHRFNILLILSLDLSISVPGCLRSAIVGVIRGHTAVVAPVVHEVSDQLNAVGGSAINDGVEALEAVGAGVNLGVLAFNKGLVPDAGCGLRYVVEA